ncbi:MAG: hypothetical protein HYS27_02425 [Deltaproteobacteria bacterium]|nr:hypothetical protein [Deltaproteobacteria bacterium]
MDMINACTACPVCGLLAFRCCCTPEARSTWTKKALEEHYFARAPSLKRAAALSASSLDSRSLDTRSATALLLIGAHNQTDAHMRRAVLRHVVRRLGAAPPSYTDFKVVHVDSDQLFRIGFGASERNDGEAASLCGMGADVTIVEITRPSANRRKLHLGIVANQLTGALGSGKRIWVTIAEPPGRYFADYLKDGDTAQDARALLEVMGRFALVDLRSEAPAAAIGDLETWLDDVSPQETGAVRNKMDTVLDGMLPSLLRAHDGTEFVSLEVVADATGVAKTDLPALLAARGFEHGTPIKLEGDARKKRYWRRKPSGYGGAAQP